MTGLKAKFRHAFAVENEAGFDPTPDQRQIVDRVAREVARRHMTTPALLFLEMSRPLNYIASQVLHYFRPIVSIVLDTHGYESFAQFLEHRGSINFLCRRIEHFEQEYTQAEKPGRGQDPRESTSDSPTEPRR